MKLLSRSPALLTGGICSQQRNKLLSPQSANTIPCVSVETEDQSLLYIIAWNEKKRKGNFQLQKQKCFVFFLTEFQSFSNATADIPMQQGSSLICDETSKRREMKIEEALTALQDQIRIRK
jgi:hypothetical protein